MEILSTSEIDLERAAQALREGKLVAIPTETVYGLGANAFDESAVARVFEVKARPTFDPLIVHIASIDALGIVARDVPQSALTLARALWPGPLTMILPKRPEVPDIVTAGLPTVAVRFPKHPVAQSIIERAAVPVAAPSANPFGYISPTTAAHVISMLKDRVDFVVDGGPCDVGVESTVIDMTGARPVLLRPGGMALETIEAVIGPVVIPKRTAHQAGEALSSPGQSLRHYAPSTPLYLFEMGGLEDALRGASFSEAPGSEDRASGILHPSVALVYSPARAHEIETLHLFDAVEVLAPSGDMREAAARLFSLLHEFDSCKFRAIYAERVPEAGLGRAINDRLYRASKK